jgi:uncharacterized membrane protein
MKAKKTTELTNEELIKNEKTIKILVISLAVLLLFLFASAIFVTSLGLLPILFILYNYWNELKKEIKVRNL